MYRVIIIGIVIVLLMGFIGGCKKIEMLDDSNTLLNNTKKGIFKLVITSGNKSALMTVTAASKEDIIGLVVTMENLEVHRTSDENAGWISLPISDGTFDLMMLDAAAWEEIISQTEIAAGNYNKLRFAVTGAQVTTENGIYDAEIPSGVIKINIPFAVYEDGKTEITISVDPEASLKITGSKTDPKYKLVPVLKVTQVDEDDGVDTDENEDD